MGDSFLLIIAGILVVIGIFFGYVKGVSNLFGSTPATTTTQSESLQDKQRQISEDTQDKLRQRMQDVQQKIRENRKNY